MAILTTTPVVQRVVILSANEIANPTQSQLADYAAIYQLNIRPWTRYHSTGEALEIMTQSQATIDSLISPLLNRSNHTGTQDDSTILHGSTALDQVVSSLLVTQTTTIPAMQSNQTSLLQRVSSVENRLAVLEAVPPPTTPPVITAAPTLAFPGGTADQGETATITQGTYSGTAVTGRTYQQVYNNINVDNPIAGPTFTISQSGTLRIVELAAYSAGVVSNQSVEYTVTPTGTPPPTAPVALAKPTLAFTGGGAADAGDTATITQGTYTDPDNTVTGRTGQVIVNGLLHSTVVNGATGNTFVVPTSAETGARQLIYVELAQNTVGTDVSNSSLPYTVNSSAAAPVNIVPPSYANGSRTSGATLSVNTGAWTPTPDSFTYQHEANLVNIGGATNNNYVLTGAEVGDYITCLVTPYNGGVAGTAVRTRRTLCVSGANTTPAIDWVEQVATDAYLGSGSLAAQWGGVDNRVSHYEDGTVRVAYLRFISSVRYMRLMKRTGVNTWVQDTEKESSDSCAVLVDPITNDPFLVGWPASVPTVYYGATYASSQAIAGTWVNVNYSGDIGFRHYGGIAIGKDGALAISENYMPVSSSTNNFHRYNTMRRFGGIWTQATQQVISFSTQSISPNGERYAYPFIYAYSTTGAASDRLAVNCLRDASLDGGSTFERDERKLYHVALSNNADIFWSNIAVNFNVDYVNPSEAFYDSLGRCWTVIREGSLHLLRIDNLDSAITQRMNDTNLSNFNDGYGRTRIIEDSRGRFWAVWLGNGGATGMKIMQLTVTGTEPTGTLALTQGSVTNLSTALNSGSAGDLNTSTATMLLATNRGGNYTDNKIYGYLFGDNTASSEKIIAFCITLPD